MVLSARALLDALRCAVASTSQIGAHSAKVGTVVVSAVVSAVKDRVVVTWGGRLGAWRPTPECAAGGRSDSCRDHDLQEDSPFPGQGSAYGQLDRSSRLPYSTLAVPLAGRPMHAFDPGR